VSDTKANKERNKPKISIIVIVIVTIVATWMILGVITRLIAFNARVVCQSNLSTLGKAMAMYAQENDGKYPTPSKWCDLLTEFPDITEKLFVCPADKEERCSYAMNPNCEPNSPSDIVLLFETKGPGRISELGLWNPYGGPVLLSFSNHDGYGGFVLFNDLSVQFVDFKRLGKLNWGDEQGNKKIETGNR